MPAKLIRLVIDKADDKLRMDFGEASKTLVHEDIIKRGILNSVAKYMYDHPLNGSNINLTKLQTEEYYDIRTLFKDYYGKYYCNIDLDVAIKTIYQFNVALVDFDTKTKDLPDAHFDGNFYIKKIKLTSTKNLFKFNLKLNAFIRQINEL